ncbi:MAG: hypothetical protein D6772_11270, partial [Bacteroidetes bacterium]
MLPSTPLSQRFLKAQFWRVEQSQTPLVAILLLFFVPLRAQQPLSLEEAITIGLANNYQIQVARAAVAVAENNNDWSLTGKYPTVNLELNSTNTYTGT